MNKVNCEDAVIKMMAVIDGDEADLSDDGIKEHLAGCESCRQEVAELQNTVLLLKKQKRLEPEDVDLWMTIEKRIGAQTKTALELKWQPFILIGVLLVAYKLIEMIPERDFGLWLKIVPFVLGIALFGFLRENPFRINAELTLER